MIRLIRRIRQLLASRFSHAAPPPQTLSSLEAYARWAATYPPHAHNVLMETEEAAMKSLLLPLAGQVVLDLACGTGRYGLLAQTEGARLALGIDNSQAMLRANTLSGKALATTEAIPLSGASVDVVLCGLALGHLPRLQPSLGEISRVLKPEGWALVSDFHPFMFLSGARRTFTANSQTYAVEHYAHLYSDFHHAAFGAGLDIEKILEPRADAAALDKAPAEARLNAPVVIVYRLRKRRT